MQEEELTRQKELQYLNQRIKEISEKEAKILAEEARTIVEFVESKIKMLKACYGKSDATVKESINRLIRSSQLQSFMAEAETEETKLGKMMYSERRIKDHINDGLFDEPRVLEFYSFYFGRYRLFFRCFGREFLENENLDKEFIDDIFSPKEGDYYVSGEKLEISGATIIDEEFISKIENKNISKSKFYAGIQDDNTQFYGVLKGYDIERKHYRNTKNIVYSCFEELDDYPISAIVYGDGGSGKSVFLRKIAVDLAKDKSFNKIILWLDSGNSVHEFISSCTETFKKHSSQKFLLIIEDWYRMMGTFDDNQIEKFLKGITSLKNIRIVIGDRSIRESYLKYFAGTKRDSVLLDSQENESIIREIVVDFPEWQKTVDELFKDGNSHQSTLFLLLFIIARTSIEDFENSNINPKEPLRTFINIIQSDFKVIQREYLGLAKALYYWACIYAENKFFITYSAFIVVANFYNKKDYTLLLNFENLELESPIHEKLRIYIHKSSDEILQFNHDIFADFGISEIFLDDLPVFNDLIRIEFLDVIIKMECQYSGSIFLNEIIKNKPHLLSKSEILRRITILIEQNYEYSADIYNYLAELDLPLHDLKSYANLFIERKYFDIHSFWKHYFDFYPQDEEIFCLLKNILHHSYDYPFQFINELLVRFRNHAFVKDFIHQAFQSNDWIRVHHLVLFRLIGSCKDEKIRKSFCNKLLTNRDWEKVDQESILPELLIHADENVSKKFSEKILQRTDWEKFNATFLWYCMEYAEKAVCQKFSNNLLKNNSRENVAKELFSQAIQYASDDCAQEYVKTILCHKDWKKEDDGFIFFCLKRASQDVVQEFAIKALDDNNYWKRLHKSYLKIIFDSADDEIIQSFYDRIFNNLDVVEIVELMDLNKEILPVIYENKFAMALAVLRTCDLTFNNWIFIYCALSFFRSVSSSQIEITAIIEKIISGYSSGIEEYSFFYCQLLTLDLQGYPQWENEIQKIENNWNSLDRHLVTSLLRLYQAYPKKAQPICLSILNSWRKEINEPVSFLYYEETHYGDHLKIAFGHPDLRESAKKIALEIYNDIKSCTINIPIYLEEIILQIVEMNNYPQWDRDGAETTMKEMVEFFEMDINDAVQFLQ